MAPPIASFRDAVLVINPFEKGLEVFFPLSKHLMKNLLKVPSLIGAGVWLTIYLETMTAQIVGFGLVCI